MNIEMKIDKEMSESKIAMMENKVEVNNKIDYIF